MPGSEFILLARVDDIGCTPITINFSINTIILLYYAKTDELTCITVN